jgi:hypothetical protein
MNAVEAADQAWVDYLLDEKAREILAFISDGDLDFVKRYEYLWKLAWIRKNWKGGGQE